MRSLKNGMAKTKWIYVPSICDTHEPNVLSTHRMCVYASSRLVDSWIRVVADCVFLKCSLFFYACMHLPFMLNAQTNIHFTLSLHILHKLCISAFIGLRASYNMKLNNNQNNPENKPHNNFAFSTPYNLCHLRVCVCVYEDICAMYSAHSMHAAT